MAVVLPSDIVLDVMKAADPQALRNAHQALVAKAAARTSRPFETRVASGNAAGPAASLESASPMRQFSAVVLQNLFKEMLPAGTSLGGSGFAGKIWESMFVDKVAEAAAARDALGLSSRLLADTVEQGDTAVALEGARDFRSAVAEAADHDIAKAFLFGMQRTALSDVDGGSNDGA